MQHQQPNNQKAKFALNDDNVIKLAQHSDPHLLKDSLRKTLMGALCCMDINVLAANPFKSLETTAEYTDSVAAEMSMIKNLAIYLKQYGAVEIVDPKQPAQKDNKKPIKKIQLMDYAKRYIQDECFSSLVGPAVLITLDPLTLLETVVTNLETELTKFNGLRAVLFNDMLMLANQIKAKSKNKGRRFDFGRPDLAEDDQLSEWQTANQLIGFLKNPHRDFFLNEPQQITTLVGLLSQLATIESKYIDGKIQSQLWLVINEIMDHPQAYFPEPGTYKANCTTLNVYLKNSIQASLDTLIKKYPAITDELNQLSETLDDIPLEGGIPVAFANYLDELFKLMSRISGDTQSLAYKKYNYEEEPAKLELTNKQKSEIIKALDMQHELVFSRLLNPNKGCCLFYCDGSDEAKEAITRMAKSSLQYRSLRSLDDYVAQRNKNLKYKGNIFDDQATNENTTKTDRINAVMNIARAMEEPEEASVAQVEPIDMDAEIVPEVIDQAANLAFHRNQEQKKRQRTFNLMSGFKEINLQIFGIIDKAKWYFGWAGNTQSQLLSRLIQLKRKTYRSLFHLNKRFGIFEKELNETELYSNIAFNAELSLRLRDFQVRAKDLNKLAPTILSKLPQIYSTLTQNVKVKNVPISQIPVDQIPFSQLWASIATPEEIITTLTDILSRTDLNKSYYIELIKGLNVFIKKVEQDTGDAWHHIFTNKKQFSNLLIKMQYDIIDRLVVGGCHVSHVFYDVKLNNGKYQKDFTPAELREIRRYTVSEDQKQEVDVIIDEKYGGGQRTESNSVSVKSQKDKSKSKRLDDTVITDKLSHSKEDKINEEFKEIEMLVVMKKTSNTALTDAELKSYIYKRQKHEVIGQPLSKAIYLKVADSWKNLIGLGKVAKSDKIALNSSPQGNNINTVKLATNHIPFGGDKLANIAIDQMIAEANAKYHAGIRANGELADGWGDIDTFAEAFALLIAKEYILYKPGRGELNEADCNQIANAIVNLLEIALNNRREAGTPFTFHDVIADVHAMKKKHGDFLFFKGVRTQALSIAGLTTENTLKSPFYIVNDEGEVEFYAAGLGTDFSISAFHRGSEEELAQLKYVKLNNNFHSFKMTTEQEKRVDLQMEEIRNFEKNRYKIAPSLTHDNVIDLEADINNIVDQPLTKQDEKIDEPIRVMRMET